MSEPDLSEFLSLSRPRRLECGVKRVLAGLAAPERRKLQAALEADANAITHAAISNWLAARKVKVQSETISRHRRRKCSCHPLP